MKNDDMYEKAMLIMPPRLKNALLKAGRGLFGRQVYEIRLYRGASAVLNTDNGLYFVDKNGGVSEFLPREILNITPMELCEVLGRATGYSLFARQRETSCGYITFGQGFRIGICFSGDSFLSENITSLCIRLPYAAAFLCAAEPSAALAAENGLLVAGAPGSGKTTMLKRLCLSLSCDTLKKPSRVSIADERGEFSVLKDMGGCIDIISGCSKTQGIERAVRLMSPEYIVCDEISTPAEAQSITGGINCGVKFVAAMHGGSLGELCRREQFCGLYKAGMFKSVLLLSGTSPGKIEKLYSNGEIEHEISRHNTYVFGGYSDRYFGCEQADKTGSIA